MNYDLIARTWDNDYRINRAKDIAEEIAKHIPEKCSSAMEFGCGTGLISFFLMDIFQKIILIDSSQGMIDTLTEKIRNANIKNMDPIMIDLANERYSGSKLDVIYSSMAYHHIIETEKITSILFDLICENGCICIVDLDEDDGGFHLNEPQFDGHNGFNQEDISRIFSEAGFVNISIHTFYHDIKKFEDKQIPYSLFFLYAEKSGKYDTK